VILFVHRPGLYRTGADYNAYEEGEPDRDITDDSFCELIVGKQRNGPTGIIYLNFSKEQACFKSREMRYDKEQIPELS